MKKKRLVLLHSVAVVADLFRPVLPRMIPNVECIHIVDEGIIQLLLAKGQLDPEITRRVAQQAMLADELNPDMILFTCSSTSPATDSVSGMVKAPVMKIDDALARKAVSLGKNILVVSTTQSAMEPAHALVETWAKKLGKAVTVEKKLLDQAFTARCKGDITLHDRIVSDAVIAAALGHDAVVLGQVSMAHLGKPLSEQTGKPVLGSLELCLEYLREAFA